MWQMFTASLKVCIRYDQIGNYYELYRYTYLSCYHRLGCDESRFEMCLSWNHGHGGCIMISPLTILVDANL